MTANRRCRRNASPRTACCLHECSLLLQCCSCPLSLLRSGGFVCVHINHVDLNNPLTVSSALSDSESVRRPQDRVQLVVVFAQHHSQTMPLSLQQLKLAARSCTFFRLFFPRSRRNHNPHNTRDANTASDSWTITRQSARTESQ